MSDFSGLILGFMGFDGDLTDEFSEWYFNRQTQLVENIDPENDEQLSACALNFYVGLVVKKTVVAYARKVATALTGRTAYEVGCTCLK